MKTKRNLNMIHVGLAISVMLAAMCVLSFTGIAAAWDEEPGAAFRFDDDVSLTKRACCRILDFHDTEANALKSENPEEFMKVALSNFFANQVSNIRAYRVNNPVYFLEADAVMPLTSIKSATISEDNVSYDPELQFEDPVRRPAPARCAGGHPPSAPSGSPAGR